MSLEGKQYEIGERGEYPKTTVNVMKCAHYAMRNVHMLPASQRQQQNAVKSVHSEIAKALLQLINWQQSEELTEDRESPNLLISLHTTEAK